MSAHRSQPEQNSMSLPDHIHQKLYRNSNHVETNRGPQLKSGIAVRYSDLENRKGHVCWGGQAITSELLNLNFLVAGVPGTGKTITIRLLLRSVFNHGLLGKNRAVLYDPKNEFFPILRGCGLEAERIHIMNPFDARASAWDLAADFTSPTDALQLATAIIPENPNASQKFYTVAARQVLTGVIETMIRLYNGQWRLDDVIGVCLDFETLKKSIDTKSYEGRTALNNLTGAHETSLNVFMELQTHLGEIGPIAALWRHAIHEKRKFSLREFVDQDYEGAVILGGSQQFEKPLMKLNRLIVKRLSELVLDTTPVANNTNNRTWLILDELKQLGKIEGLAKFVTMGRDRGVCAVFGFQDYPGLIEILGEDGAHELVSCCRHKLFLKLDNKSAEWASNILGKQEVTRTNITSQQGMGFGASIGSSESVGGGSSRTTGNSGTTGYSRTYDPGFIWDGLTSKNKSYSSTWSSSDTQSHSWSNSTNIGANANISSGISVSREVRERDVVMPAEIMNLPDFKKGGGIHGYTVDSGDGTELPTVYKIFVSSEECLPEMIQSSDKGFIKADDKKQDFFGELT